MNAPICDFVKKYAEANGARFHMPGHKGKGPLGFEALDITEIDGADNLFAPNGVIAESEKNAETLFGCKTLYSAGGSTNCIWSRCMPAKAGARRVSSPRGTYIRRSSMRARCWTYASSGSIRSTALTTPARLHRSRSMQRSKMRVSGAKRPTRYTSPVRIISETFWISRAFPMYASGAAFFSAWTTRTARTFDFCANRATPSIWARISAAIRRTKPCPR